MIITQLDLIGTWSLVEHSEIKDNLKGELKYGSDNKMSVHITGNISGVEVQISYSGTYHLEIDCVVHIVENSDKPTRIGTKQRRYIQMDGPHMIFTGPDSDSDLKIIWKKGD